MIERVQADFTASSTSLPAHRFITVNCMHLTAARQIYDRVLGEDIEITDTPTVTDFLSRRPMYDTTLCRVFAQRLTIFRVLIVDEMDQLLTKDQEVIYRLFDWTLLPGSLLVVVGIANALNLIERLPRLSTYNCPNFLWVYVQH